eukprot:PhF_6_TR11716/c3_g2_i8/m.19100
MSNFSFTSSMVESTLQSLNNVDAAGVQELIPYTTADITSWITPLANLILDRTIQQHNRQRYLIGITGPSGGGKSVLGQCMSAVFNSVSMELGGDTICIGVDGYYSLSLQNSQCYGMCLM